MDSQTLDFDARYTVDGYRGVAFYLKGYVTTEEYDGDLLICEDDEDCAHLGETCWLAGDYETVENPNMVIAVMVGDDREHLVDVSDLTKLDDEDYCGVCGQCGCTADGR